MEVFTTDFAEWMAEEPACDMGEVVPLTITSIRHGSCTALQIVPIEHVSYLNQYF